MPWDKHYAPGVRDWAPGEKVAIPPRVGRYQGWATVVRLLEDHYTPRDRFLVRIVAKRGGYLQGQELTVTRQQLEVEARRWQRQTAAWRRQRNADKRARRAHLRPAGVCIHIDCAEPCALKPDGTPYCRCPKHRSRAAKANRKHYRLRRRTRAMLDAKSQAAQQRKAHWIALKRCWRCSGKVPAAVLHGRQTTLCVKHHRTLAAAMQRWRDKKRASLSSTSCSEVPYTAGHGTETEEDGEGLTGSRPGTGTV